MNKRKAIYQKITILKKEPLNMIPTNVDFSYEFVDDRNLCLETLEKNTYAIKEHIQEDEKKYYFIVRRHRVMIKNYNLKSHLTVTLL